MRKIRLATVSLFCTLLFLSCGVSASAFAVEFDEQTGMEPVLERAVGIAPGFGISSPYFSKYV